MSLWPEIILKSHNSHCLLLYTTLTEDSFSLKTSIRLSTVLRRGTGDRTNFKKETKENASSKEMKAAEYYRDEHFWVFLKHNIDLLFSLLFRAIYLSRQKESSKK